MNDEVTTALAGLGLEPGDVDPDVLAALRRAAERGPRQITAAELKTMSPEAIVKAKNDGRLDTILGKA